MKLNPCIIGEQLPECAAAQLMAVLRMHGVVNRRTRRDILIEAGELVRKQRPEEGESL